MNELKRGNVVGVFADERAAGAAVSVSCPGAERDRARRLPREAGAVAIGEEGTVEAAGR